MRSLRVLVVEPPNQQLPVDTARPNRSLGPAYLVGALHAQGVEADPLRYTDRMHWRGRPPFPTLVPAERLEAAIREFWLELNQSSYVAGKVAQNVATVA